jgi:two-component system CheB/CheR fusion protein
MTNITDKKEAEQKLRKNYQELIKVKENLKQVNTNLEEKIAERTHNLTISEERFRLIAGATNDAVWDRDIVNNKIWWNESFYKLFGYEAKDITNETSFWLDKIHPDDKKRVEKSIHDVINSGLRQWTASYRFLKADGVYAHINDKGAVINDEFGIPYRMVGAMSDVSLVEHTELRLKEKNIELEKVIQEFKFVTDFMPQMVWSTQPDGYHDFYNKGWYDYTGLDFEATKDKGWDLVLHPNDAERTWKVWRHSLQTGDFYEIEYRMRRYDGQYRWFLARAIPLKDPEGKIVKWFGTCTDIHDQKMISDILEQKVEERTTELRKINAALEVTNAELFQFASVASHDLKEPLRKIHMFSTLIKDRYLNEESNGAADYMNRIISSSARMTKLINDLLAFSRLSIQSLFEKTDLNQVVQEVLSDLELVITEKDACVEVQTLPVIDAVPGQLRQVFQNIISNALKFTSEGKTPHIVIRSQIISAEETGLEDGMEGEYCKIILSDNGIGFDEQHATKIFTIFQRLHGREKYEGTGIGLAITKKIIDKHNGLIYANSTHNEGSVFTIILPVKQNMERIKETSIG